MLMGVLNPQWRLIQLFDQVCADVCFTSTTALDNKQFAYDHIEVSCVYKSHTRPIAIFVDMA